MELVEGSDREVGDVVLGVLASAEGLLLLAGDSDHGEEHTADFNLAAKGIVHAEEFVGRVVAKHGDVGRTFLIAVGEEAARGEIEVMDVLVGCRHALEGRALHLAAVALDGGRADSSSSVGVIGILQRGRDGNHMRQAAHGHGIVVGHLLAGEHLGGWTLAEDRKAEDEQNVRTERLDEVFDVRVEIVDDRRDNNDSEDADDDAQNGERTAHLVGAQRVHGHCHGFFEVTDAHGCASGRFVWVAWLVGPEGDDGVEHGGFPSRIDAEEDTGRGGDKQTHDHAP